MYTGRVLKKHTQKIIHWVLQIRIEASLPTASLPTDLFTYSKCVRSA